MGSPIWDIQKTKIINPRHSMSSIFEEGMGVVEKPRIASGRSSINLHGIQKKYTRTDQKSFSRDRFTNIIQNNMSG